MRPDTDVPAPYQPPEPEYTPGIGKEIGLVVRHAGRVRDFKVRLPMVNPETLATEQRGIRVQARNLPAFVWTGYRWHWIQATKPSDAEDEIQAAIQGDYRVYRAGGAR